MSSTRPRSSTIKMSRREFLQAAGITSVAVVLAACGAQTTATTAPQGATPTSVAAGPTPTEAPTSFVPSSDVNTVDIWVQQVSIDVMKGTAKLFMEKNPDIKVNFVPMTMNDASTNLLAAIAAGAGAPDSAFIDWYNIMKFSLRDGTGLNDLTPLMASAGYQLTDWVKWDLDLVTTQSGKLIGLPEDLGMAMMFYRRDVFDAAGQSSDPDSVAKLIDTWDDMIAIGQKVTAPGKRWMLNHATDVWNIVQQEGEVSYFDKNGLPIVNSPKFVKAAQLSVQVRKAGIDAKMDWWSSDWEVARNKVPGVVALYPCAAWWDQIIQPAAPNTKGMWGVVPLPSKASWNTGGSFFVFPQMSKKWEKAFKFTSYLEASDEGLTEYMKSGKFLPGYRKFYSSPIFTTADPFYGNQVWLKAFADQVDNAAPIHLTLNDPVASEVLSQSISNILEKNADINAELDSANQEIKKRTAGT